MTKDISDIDRIAAKKGLKLVELTIQKGKVTLIRYRHPLADALGVPTVPKKWTVE